jgi:hypothetical protein
LNSRTGGLLWSVWYRYDDVFFKFICSFDEQWMSTFSTLRKSCFLLCVGLASFIPRRCYKSDLFYLFLKYGGEEIHDRARLFSVFGQDVSEICKEFLHYFD